MAHTTTLPKSPRPAVNQAASSVVFRTLRHMTHPYWPLFDLRLRTGDVTLRPMTETDQLTVAARLPADVELNRLPRRTPLTTPM